MTDNQEPGPYDPAADLPWLRSLAPAEYPPQPAAVIRELMSVLANLIEWVERRRP